MTPLEFQKREISDFLQEEYPFDDARSLLPELTQSQYPGVIRKTESAISTGIYNFLGGEGVIYTSQRLRDFCFDTTTKDEIQKAINIKGSEDFADDVCMNYRSFVYNESFERFEKEFL